MANADVSGALWPWIEANQGLVSISALLAAIVVAFAEHYRILLKERAFRANTRASASHAFSEMIKHLALILESTDSDEFQKSVALAQECALVAERHALGLSNASADMLDVSTGLSVLAGVSRRFVDHDPSAITLDVCKRYHSWLLDAKFD